MRLKDKVSIVTGVSSGDSANLEKLVSVPNEMEAAAIVNALADHDVQAQAVGGHTSGFRAEAPGQVAVVVGRADLARAREALANIHDEFTAVDWANIDCGDPEPPSEEATDDEAKGGPVQFSIASLLILQTVASLAFAWWRAVQVGLLDGVLMFLSMYAVILGVTFTLLVAGTVSIASDLSSARQGGKYSGLASVVGLVSLGLFVLLAKFFG